MLKERLTYIDFDGRERTEDFFFYLSKAEVLELNLGTTGGLEKLLQKIVDAQDNIKIYDLFKEIIRKSYGEKSLDGKYFIKKAPDGHLLADDFEQTEAFSELIVRIMGNINEAAAFIKGILPQELQNNVDTSNIVELPHK